MSRSLMLVDDILRHIDDIRDFISGLTEADFLADKKTKAAIIFKLMVIGEAVKRLPEELKWQYPEIAWNKIVRSRNIMAHDYEIIDYTIIWKIVRVHIPELEITMKEIKNDIHG